MDMCSTEKKKKKQKEVKKLKIKEKIRALKDQCSF